MVTRAALLRALVTAVVVVLAAGSALGLLLFGGTIFGSRIFGGRDMLPSSAAPYYAIGLGAAGFAAFFTIWLHGRFAAVGLPPGAGSDPARVGHLITARLQTLLAAAFAVKLAVLVLGLLVLKQFPLGEEPAKFADTATFAVSFAGAALLCQLVTSLLLARSLRGASSRDAT